LFTRNNGLKGAQRLKALRHKSNTTDKLLTRHNWPDENPQLPYISLV